MASHYGIVGWFCILLAVFPNPVGKILIKKSFEVTNPVQASRYYFWGNVSLIVFTPIFHVLAYFYGENRFIAPILASGVLLNIVLARFFLSEGTQMNWYTFTGSILFCIGLFAILWSYASLLTQDDTEIEWGIFSLYLGVWMWLLTVFTCLLIFSHFNSLYLWSAIAAILSALDIIGTYDKWIFDNTQHSFEDIASGALASVLYTMTCLLSIYITNQLLSNSANPVHIVATIAASGTLILDVFADMFVYQRSTDWTIEDWTLSVTGIALMVCGIGAMNRQFAPTQALNTSLQLRFTNQRSCNEDEDEDLALLLQVINSRSLTLHKTAL